jgi:hypothetical protein
MLRPVPVDRHDPNLVGDTAVSSESLHISRRSAFSFQIISSTMAFQNLRFLLYYSEFHLALRLIGLWYVGESVTSWNIEVKFKQCQAVRKTYSHICEWNAALWHQQNTLDYRCSSAVAPRCEFGNISEDDEWEIYDLGWLHQRSGGSSAMIAV